METSQYSQKHLDVILIKITQLFSFCYLYIFFKKIDNSESCLPQELTVFPVQGKQLTRVFARDIPKGTYLVL